jgi:aryl-alcohol dehydrogenase-like predicted oxidoreductase
MGILLNKLALGTVQFGLDYGINNQLGKPSRKKSLAMLDFAWKRGIKTFDTAYAYGDAEDILGEFIKTRNLAAEIKIITKLKPNILTEKSGKVAKIIGENLFESLGRLQRDYVDGYLLHTPSYIYNNKVIKALVDLKKHGQVKNIGVSIYEEGDALYAAGLKEFDYIQVPYSIFDQRLDKTPFFEIAKKNNKTIFARSAFLQGLFFMPDKKIPPHLNISRPYFKKLDKIISKYNLSRQQAALFFSYKNTKIDYVVFGVDKLTQLKENLEIVEKNVDCESCIRELKRNFINVEKYIVFPSLWKK